MLKTLLKYKIIDLCLNILFKNVKNNFTTSDIIKIQINQLNHSYIGYDVYHDGKWHQLRHYTNNTAHVYYIYIVHSDSIPSTLSILIRNKFDIIILRK